MEYKDKDLTFNSTNIATDVNEFVMMDWEDTIMAASAEYICSNGGDILEIGFGMGISANYIQSYTITTNYKQYTCEHRFESEARQMLVL